MPVRVLGPRREMMMEEWETAVERAARSVRSPWIVWGC